MISRQIVMSPNLLFIKTLSPKLDGMCRRSGCCAAENEPGRYATAVRCGQDDGSRSLGIRVINQIFLSSTTLKVGHLIFYIFYKPAVPEMISDENAFTLNFLFFKCFKNFLKFC